jgi:hypothetical protein
MLSSSVWRGRSHLWFITGLATGGLVTGLILAVAGSLFLRPFLSPELEVALFIAAASLLLLNELQVINLRVPQNARQVSPAIAADGAQYGALQFGFEMGTGARTYMTSGLPHALATAALLLLSPLQAVAAGIAFGMGRAIMLMSRRAYPGQTEWDALLRRWDRRLRGALAIAFFSSAIPIAVFGLLK